MKIIPRAKSWTVEGREYARLTVLGPEFTIKSCRLVVVMCQCGVIKVVRAGEIKRHIILSCGCFHRENQRLVAKTHDSVNEPLYRHWCAMRSRCKCTSDGSYGIYGGRGIGICEEWDDYVKFRSWSHENGYRLGLSIDRIDCNGNYTPSNCRWATHKEQARNRRNNVQLRAFGEEKCIASWAEDHRCSVGETVLRKRVSAGWDLENAITQCYKARRVV